MYLWLDGFSRDIRVLGELVMFWNGWEECEKMVSFGGDIKDIFESGDYTFYDSNLFCYMSFTSNAWLLEFCPETWLAEFI